MRTSHRPLLANSDAMIAQIIAEHSLSVTAMGFSHKT